MLPSDVRTVTLPDLFLTGNSSTTPAPATRTRCFLSTDFVAGNDVPPGGQRRPLMGLAAGAASTGTVIATVPNSTALGSYYVIACADYISMGPGGFFAGLHQTNAPAVAAAGAESVPPPGTMTGKFSAPPAP